MRHWGGGVGGEFFLEDFGQSQEFAKLKYGANDWYVEGS